MHALISLTIYTQQIINNVQTVTSTLSAHVTSSIEFSANIFERFGGDSWKGVRSWCLLLGILRFDPERLHARNRPEFPSAQAGSSGVAFLAWF
jgi:hypothetical protein